jgi:hypothetical protein
MDYLVEGSKPSTQGKLVKTHQYENPGTHDPTGGANPYNPNKSVLPENHIELFEQSKPFVNKKGKVLRFTKDVEGVIHRFEPSLENLYHWNGSTNGVTKSGKPWILEDKCIPAELRRGGE